MELFLDIVTPFGKKYSGEVKYCIATSPDGKFQVLDNHAPMLSLLGIGSIEIESSKGKEKMATAGGFFEVQENKLAVVVESAEWIPEIDIERAQAAKKRAEERLRKKTEVDISRARAALARAINRIKLASSD